MRKKISHWRIFAKQLLFAGNANVVVVGNVVIAVAMVVGNVVVTC